MVLSTSVYLVWPARIASIAASLTKSGVSKSGSPALRPMTSTPSAFSLVTRAVIASVADGWMRPRAAETWGLKVDIEKRPCERARGVIWRSEEHTSELQSLMRISYAVFCLKKKKRRKYH